MKTSTIIKLVVWIILFIILLKVGFSMITQMTSGLQYPQTLVAVQEAQKAQNEVLKIKAEAEKKIAAANGEAQALKIKGDAEAEYNRKIAASLSPLIVQQMMLDKWDGKLPVYGTMPTLFKDIAGK